MKSFLFFDDFHLANQQLSEQCNHLINHPQPHLRGQAVCGSDVGGLSSIPSEQLHTLTGGEGEMKPINSPSVVWISERV